jgi:DNA-binding SARP family transcriptional activator
MSHPAIVTIFDVGVDEESGAPFMVLEYLPGESLADRLVAAARGAPVGVDPIVETLWGDTPPAKPADQVSVLASRLRRALGSDRVVRTDAGYALAADWLDVAELDARVDEARTRLAAGSAGAARVAAAAALDLVRGPLAGDEDALWFDGPRAAVDRTVAQARDVLAEAALAAGDPATAVDAAAAALERDPYDERALRHLMRAHVVAGRPASALDAYARVRARLGDDLGVDPAPETEQLHTAILRREVSTPVVVDRDTAAVVGRERELAALDAWLARAESGEAVTVVVEGDAGVGKTTLVREWGASVAARGTPVLRGQCDPLGHGLALQPVLDALDAHLHRLPPDRAAELLGGEAAPIGPLVAGGGTRVTGDEPTQVADPEAGQAVLHAALLAVVDRIRGDASAVVLVVDDLHLAAPGTVAWLSFAGRRSTRLLIVATRRTGPGASVPGAVGLDLGPLDVAAIAVLVGDDARATTIHARSGGNPLFATALASHQGDDVPRSIRDAVTARTDELGDAAATLRAAAVLGVRLDLDLVAAALRAPVAELLDHIETALDTRLLVERDGDVVFEHELVRDALVDATPAATRAYFHRAAAAALTARPGHDPVAVARHARIGGDDAVAARALTDAGLLAFARYDLDEAGRLLDEALALDDVAPTRLARARVDLARFRLDEAARHADAARERGGGTAALELGGWIAYYQRDYDAARRFADEGLRRAGDSALRASCLALAGRLRHAHGELDEAARHLEEAVETSSSDVLPVARTWLAGLRAHQGRAAEAVDLAARAELDDVVAPHPFAPLHARFAHAHGLGQLGRAAEALAVVERVADAAARAGGSGSRFTGVAANCRGWILRNLGHLDEAAALNAVALELDSAVAVNAEPRYAARLDVVEGHLARDDLDAAGAAIEALADLDTWNGTMAWHQRHRLGVQRARLALRTGDASGAADLAEAVVTDAAARGAARYETLASLVRARARAASGATVDVAELERTVDALPNVAGMEAWWLTAEVAAELGSDRWRVASERLVDDLVARAGPAGTTLPAFARRRWALLSG